MKSKKTVLMIPGFRHKIGQKGYILVRKKLQQEGYKVVSVAIPWRDSTIVENTAYFLEKYHRIIEKLDISGKDMYLLGFSYGALIAFLASTKTSIGGLILCSLSPFFKEDLPRALPKNSSALQLKRFEAFSQLHAGKLARKVKAKSVCMLYGERESASLIKRSQYAFKALVSKKKYLFTIQKTDHSISDKKYINAIHFACNFL